MLGSAILEALIGTVVIYTLLSLICVVLNEWVTRLFQLRSGLLRNEIYRLLGEKLSTAIDEHPLIHNTCDRKRFPDYIPTSTFALALMDLAYNYRPGTHGNPGTTEVKSTWKGADLVLLESLRLAATSPGPIQTRIEKWFDLAMETAAGKFKRTVNLVVLATSGVIVMAGNVNTIVIASGLYDSAITRTATKFTLFWSTHPEWYVTVAGLGLTWAAVSLGAPFWFEMLTKLVNLRQTGLPPDENKRQQS